MPSNHLILCRPLLLLPSIFPSIRVFSNESALCIRWPKYWSFSFNISPSNEHQGLISFRMDCLDLLAVLGPPANSCLRQLQRFNGMDPREATVQLCRENTTVNTAGHTILFSSHQDERLPTHNGSPPNFHIRSACRECAYTKLQPVGWNLGFLRQSEALTSLHRGSEM